VHSWDLQGKATFQIVPLEWENDQLSIYVVVCVALERILCHETGMLLTVISDKNDSYENEFQYNVAHTFLVVDISSCNKNHRPEWSKDPRGVHESKRIIFSQKRVPYELNHARVTCLATHDNVFIKRFVKGSTGPVYAFAFLNWSVEQNTVQIMHIECMPIPIRNQCYFHNFPSILPYFP
jgi:hypothetical protein